VPKKDGRHALRIIPDVSNVRIRQFFLIHVQRSRATLDYVIIKHA
jgi:hypothetical protein